MRIGFDMMGGDHAPQECVNGLKLFEADADPGLELVLIGKKALILPAMESCGCKSLNYSIVDAQEIIEMDDSPTRAFAQKPNSSIAIGFSLLKEKKIDAFVSAGNTGAMLVGTLMSVKTVDGVSRPAIATVIPRQNGSTGILLDVGANADCKPEHLVQFAILGSLYSKHMLGYKNPKVALVSIGEEEGKGNILVQQAYEQLKTLSGKINFTGNVEGRHIFTDLADVMVCDGFTGNVVLKLGESFYDLLKGRSISDPFVDSLNYENYGGMPIIGVNAPVIIGHGISSAKAFRNMLIQARDLVKTDLIHIFQNEFSLIREAN